MTLEQFKKDFDERLAAISDEELIQQFKDMGCEVEIKKPVVVLLRGTQSSGKSTVAKLFGENSIICCADDYFTDNQGNYNFDITFIGVAHRICREKFTNALDDPDIDTIVVSNTNATQKDFQFYIDSAEQRGIMVFSLVVERRHNSFNNHNVPQEAIDRCEENIKNSLKLK